MRFVVMVSVLWASGCLRIIDLDDDDQVDAIVVTGDAAPLPDGAWDQDCSVPLPCPPPEAGRLTLCGWIHDVESDGVVAAASPTRQACSGVTDTGPCALRVRYFDALDFAGDPSAAVPIVPASAMVDDCGRFRAQNLSRPQFGFLAVVVDDVLGITPVTPHRLTSVAVANALAAPGLVRAYSTRVSTDMMWSTSAGLAGMTFAQRGVLLKVFTYGGQPRAGVTVRRNDILVPADDFYFSDPGVARTTIAPLQMATGASGSVLVINASTPVAHDGTGAEPSGCEWPANLGAATPGAVWVDLVEAETPAGAICP